MALYSLSEQAKIGLQEIWGYIAQDNPIAADKVEGKLLQAFALLAERPFIGQRREDMTSLEVRFWPVFSYQIVYHAEAHPLQIIRILSGYRDIGGILEN